MVYRDGNNKEPPGFAGKAAAPAGNAVLASCVP